MITMAQLIVKNKMCIESRIFENLKIKKTVLKKKNVFNLKTVIVPFKINIPGTRDIYRAIWFSF